MPYRPIAFMKICDVTQFYAPRSGGVKRYLRAKIEYLQQPASGDEHVLIVPDAQSPFRNIYAPGDVGAHLNQNDKYDGFGQAFCFASEADRTQFQRRRIELGARHQDRVAVLRGLDDDDSVVSVGAEQLAAKESKADLAVEDND